MSLATDIVVDLLDHINEEKLIQIAESAAKRHKIRAVILYGTSQKLESVLKMLEEITGPHFRWFSFTHSIKMREHMILFNHARA